MRKYFAAAILVVATVGVTSPASATYVVDAKADSIPSPLDTGLILNPGDLYNFSVENPSTLWSAGNGPQYQSTANGIPYAAEVAAGFNDNGIPGGWNFDGFYADFGSLIGYTPTNGYFFIGTGKNLSGLTGDLSLMYWDAYPVGFDGYADNSGIQTLDVSDLGQVPEPITLSLFGAGLAGAVGMRRKSKPS